MMFGGKQVVVCGYGEVNSWASVCLFTDLLEMLSEGDLCYQRGH